MVGSIDQAWGICYTVTVRINGGHGPGCACARVNGVGRFEIR